ncbi:MAG: metal ABC transporter permease [Gammaproteobacteria bacterium]|nr:MAG: metal ABC transporter permease [Gammaproteobacteria bacterium]
MLVEVFLAPFMEFAFMRRALLGYLLLAAGAAPVGVFLLLRRMTLAGEAVAHGILPGIAVAFVISGLSLFSLTLGGLAGGLVVALSATWMARRTLLREDATLATLYLLAVALGVLLISSHGRNVDLLHFLFGGILGLDDPTLQLLAAIAAVSIVAMTFLIRPLTFESVDPAFMRVVSGRGGLIHGGFMALVVLNLVAGFHALGTLLALGVMVLPAAAARLWSQRLSVIVALAVLGAWFGGFSGLLLSFHLDVPSGPSIVAAIGFLFVISLTFAPAGGLFGQGLARSPTAP